MASKSFIEEISNKKAEGYKSKEMVDNRWSKMCDFIIYPIARMVESQKSGLILIYILRSSSPFLHAVLNCVLPLCGLFYL